MLPNLQSLTLKGSFTQSSVRRVILRVVSLLRAFAALPSLVECSLCDSVAPSSNAQMASMHSGILLGPSTTGPRSDSTPGPQPLPQLNDLLLVAKRLLPALPQHTRHLSLTTSLVAAPDLASFLLDPPRLPHLATLRVGGALARDTARLDRWSGLGHKLWERGIEVTTVQ